MDKCPLTGKPCDKERNVHFTQVVGGKKTSLDMCDECASAYNPYGNMGKAFMHGFGGLPSLAEALFTNLGVGKITTSPEEKTPQCSCGVTWDDIRQSGLVGCANCYTTFKDRMTPLLAKIHDETHHCGKQPLLSGSPEKLKAKLEEAIKAEKYEDAARIRDHLKS